MPDDLNDRLVRVETKIESLEKEITNHDKRLDLGFVKLENYINKSITDLTVSISQLSKEFKEYQARQKTVLGWIGKNLFNITSTILIAYLLIKLGLK